MSSKKCTPPPEGKEVIYALLEGYEGGYELHSVRVEKFSPDGEHVYLTSVSRASNYRKRVPVKYCCFTEEEAIQFAIKRLNRKIESARRSIKADEEHLANISANMFKRPKRYKDD